MRHVTAGGIPVEATAPACRGPGVAALGLYITQRQHLPIKWATEFLSDVMGAAVPTGFLVALAERTVARLAPLSAGPSNWWPATRSSTPTRPRSGCPASRGGFMSWPAPG